MLGRLRGVSGERQERRLVQRLRGLGIGMRVVDVLGRRRRAGEWQEPGQERRLVRCGSGIRIAILIAISDTRIFTSRRPIVPRLADETRPDPE